MEAAEALEPEKVRRMLDMAGDLRGFANALGADLVRAVLRARHDLTFSGRDLSGPIDAPPVVVPRELLAADTAPDGSLFLLRFCDQSLELRFGSVGQRLTLHAVRVVPAFDGRSPPQMARPAARKGGAGKNGGGRTVSREVATVIARLGAKLAAEGTPEARQGGQASLERWFADELAALGASLAEGNIRKHVRRAIEEHRKAIG